MPSTTGRRRPPRLLRRVVLLAAVVLVAGSCIAPGTDVAVVQLVGGTGSSGYAGDGGPAVDAQLRSPWGVAVAPDGTVYVADWTDHRVRRIDADGTISTAAGTGSAGSSGDGGPAAAARLQDPADVALDGGGNLYVTSGDRVRRIDPDGTISTIAGGGSDGDPAEGTPATDAHLGGVGHLAIGSDGTVFVTALRSIDGGPGVGWVSWSQVWRIDPAGRLWRHAGAPAGGATCWTDGCPADEVELLDPLGLSVDPAGSLFIAEWGANKVRRVDAAGTITTFAGTGVEGFAGDGGPATAAALDHPYDVVAVGVDQVHIADWGNARIRSVGFAGPIIVTVAGTGNGFAVSPDGTLATAAHIGTPWGLAAAPDGSLLVSDPDHAQVRRIAPAVGAAAWGRVTEDGTTPVAGTTVELWVPGAFAPALTTTTDAHGWYGLSVPAGSYKLRIVGDGSHPPVWWPGAASRGDGELLALVAGEQRRLDPVVPPG